MQKNHLLKKTILVLVGTTAVLAHAQAQTVLSGDHIVEGNLDVGDATQEGVLTIKGETGNAANPGIRVTGDGGVIFEGTEGVGTIPAEGAGVRMMWYPKKAAFRAGALSAQDGGMWNDQEIGFSSVAFGGSKAYGDYSIAMSGGEATGSYSAAMSRGTSYGSYSTAMSGGWTPGQYSTGMSGGGADGLFTTAMSGGEAYSSYSTAMSGGWAFTDYSTVMSGGWAWGGSSIAGGTVESITFRCVVFGSYNDPNWSESPFEWVETDSIFVVGNGTGRYSDPPEVRKRNALVILKNGNIQIPKRQGDILMGEFGNPEP